MCEICSIFNLDDYEKEILKAYENGRLKPTESGANCNEIAENTLKKNRMKPTIPQRNAK